jgi:exportin-1
MMFGCFFLIALLDLAPGQFKLVIDSVVWGFKHTMRDIADTGLQICGELVQNVSCTDPSIAGGFYQTYYLSILQDIFFVLTDRDHKSGKSKKGVSRVDDLITFISPIL